jgi:YD repeat-containing protein
MVGDRKRRCSPETHASSDAYDPAGNLTAATYPNGVQSVLTYDALNRVTGRAMHCNSDANMLSSAGLVILDADSQIGVSIADRRMRSSASDIGTHCSES